MELRPEVGEALFRWAGWPGGQVVWRLIHWAAGGRMVLTQVLASTCCLGSIVFLSRPPCRPHPKGPHMLALTLLLPGEVVQHIDIKEGAKVGLCG